MDLSGANGVGAHGVMDSGAAAEMGAPAIGSKESHPASLGKDKANIALLLLLYTLQGACCCVCWAVCVRLLGDTPS